MMSLPVAIIGASLAGLACARRLRELEIPFVIFEASDAVGGWLKGTYPVLVSSFPEVRRINCTEMLDLQPLTVSVFRNGTIQPFDFSLLNRLPLTGDDETAADQPAIDYLRWAGGLSEEVINRFFRPLAGAFFLECELRTSARLFRFLIRHIRSGTLTIPTNGMAALTERMKPDSIRFRSRAARIEPGMVVRDDDSEIDVRGIVVATDGAEAHRLIGNYLSEPVMNGTVVVTYRTPDKHRPALILNGDGKGIANHVVQNGTATMVHFVGILDEKADAERSIRSQLVDWFGGTSRDWKWESTDCVQDAIPDMSVGTLNPWQRPVRIRPGLYVCGDHRDQATINGMLESGYRTAQVVAEDIEERRM